MNAAIAGPAAAVFGAFLGILVVGKSADWGAAAVVLEPSLIFGGLHGCNALALVNSMLL